MQESAAHARNGLSRAMRRSRERSERDAGELAHRKAEAPSGAGRLVYTSQGVARHLHNKGPWWTSKGRGRRSRSSPDDGSASKASGGQRESLALVRQAPQRSEERSEARDGERPRAFGCLDRLFAIRLTTTIAAESLEYTPTALRTQRVDNYYRVELQYASY